MSSDESNHTTAERIKMIISIAILVGIIGWAGWAGFVAGDAPPEINVDVDMEGMRETASGYYVPITITNDGGLTAQSVIVTGELVIDGSEPETADVTIDFLSGGESEKAELIFSTNPTEGDLTVAPTSYLQP